MVARGGEEEGEGEGEGRERAREVGERGGQDDEIGPAAADAAFVC